MTREQRNSLCLKWENTNESEKNQLRNEYIKEYGTYEPWAFWEEYLTRKIYLTPQQTGESSMPD